jgi:hypothetical protein
MLELIDALLARIEAAMARTEAAPARIEVEADVVSAQQAEINLMSEDIEKCFRSVFLCPWYPTSPQDT